MAITVGGKTTQKRVSLSDRRRIAEINRRRRAQGKGFLKGSENVETRQEKSFREAAEAEDRRLLEKAGYKDASPEVLQRLREEEAAKQALGVDKVQRVGDRYVAVTEQEQRTTRQQPERPRSTALGTSGIQQIPGVQTNTGSTAQQTFTPAPEAEPVASSEQGVLYADKQGNIYYGTTTTEEGTVLEAFPQREVKLSDRRLPTDYVGKGDSGFLLPLGYVGEERRKDIIRLGEFIEQKAAEQKKEEASGSFAGEALRRSPLAAFNLQAIASNLKAIGYNPKEYATENVVLPAVGGGAVAVGSKLLVRGVGAVASSGVATGGIKASTGIRAVYLTEKGLTASGIALLGGTVISRSAEEQRPDVVFAALGASAASKPSEIPTKPSPVETLYGGTPTPGLNKAGRIRVGSGYKPTSKAQLRKQSYNQQYNPNLYRNAGEYGAKIGKQREFIRFAEKGVIELGTRRPATEFGVQGQSYEAGLKISKSGQPVPFSQYKFTPQGKPYELPKSPGAGKRSKAIDKLDYKLGYQDTVVALKQTQVGKALETFSSGKRQPVFKPEVFKPTARSDATQIPEYELTPNVVRPSPSLGVRGTQRGGFRTRKSGDKVLDFRPDVVGKPQSKELVIVDYGVPAEYSSPVKDVALNRELPGGVSQIKRPELRPTLRGNNEGLKTSVTPGAIIDSTSGGRVITGSPQIIAGLPRQVNKEELAVASITAPILLAAPSIATSSGSKTENISKPIQFVETRSLQQQEQTPIQIQDYAQKTETRQEFVSEPVVPGGKIFDLRTEVPSPPPPPIKIIKNFINEPPPRKPQSITENPPPQTPKFFGLPEKEKSLGATFRVVVGRRGRKTFIDLGTGGEDLVKRGGSIAKNTAAATVTVFPIKGGGGSDIKSVLGKQFKETRPGVYVQETKYRISSSGEKEQIPGAAARKKRGLTQNEQFIKALALGKQGYSLRNIRRILS